MKKILIFCIFFMLLACNGHFETVTQHGTVIDVEYNKPYTTTHRRPVIVGNVHTVHHYKVHHPEYWRAHVHYNDTICVQEDFDHKVKKGDRVTRNVRIFVKDK